MNLDERASILLTTLVHQYIAQGTPVGSQALMANSGLSISSATVRNVMAELEQLGLIASPHTSAGRIPTPAGYRFFVDAMMTANAFTANDEADLSAHDLSGFSADTPARMANQAAQTLSQLSHFAGIIATPKRSQVFGQIDFLQLSPTRILVVMVTPEGDVQNRLLQLEQAYTPSQLNHAANYLNSHFAGKTFEHIRTQLANELAHLQNDVNVLMQQAVARTSESSMDEDALIVKGERHLLDVSEFANNMQRLRQTFDLFDEKTRLLQLLEHTRTAGGIQVFIGGESDVLPYDGVSLICAPYAANNQIMGTLGVIGPSRMAYEKVIPMVDVTAKLLSRAMQNFT
ncbi:MAG: heat-inducible transcriptional repressor HrcA [Burkholderiales bacterium]|jgi:heat-inducible transcriptional repressor|nr:heat-inducible transcriptional repressor HrcA [Burkholderiales bacterium]